MRSSPLAPRMRHLVAALAVATAPAAGAGEAPSRWERTLDASLAAQRDRGTVALSWNHLWRALPGRLSAGVGARFTTLYAHGPLVFRTGDPDLVAAGRVNRLVVRDALVSSLNLQVLAVVRIAGPLEAGFDIDLVGVSFGPRRTGDYDATDPALAGAREARVSSFDLLLGDVRDRGQLDSEYFLGLRLGPRWTVRGGLSHVATEYRSRDRLDHGNRRFRRFTTNVFAGVSRRLP